MERVVREEQGAGRRNDELNAKNGLRKACRTLNRGTLFDEHGNETTKWTIVSRTINELTIVNGSDHSRLSLLFRPTRELGPVCQLASSRAPLLAVHLSLSLPLLPFRLTSHQLVLNHVRPLHHRLASPLVPQGDPTPQRFNLTSRLPSSRQGDLYHSRSRGKQEFGAQAGSRCTLPSLSPASAVCTQYQRSLSLTSQRTFALVQLQSPIAPFVGQEVAPRIGIAPILRAGIGMTERTSPSPSPSHNAPPPHQTRSVR